MKRIFKYNLSICDEQFVEMPKGAQILSVAIQNDSVKMWALVDPDEEKEKRPIICHGTGHDASDVTADMFIGTILTHYGSLVFHFFDPQKGRNND